MNNMTPRDYVIWLQGMMQMIGDRMPTEAEWAMLKERHNEQFGSVVAYDMLQRIEQDKKEADAARAAYGRTYPYLGGVQQSHTFAAQDRDIQAMKMAAQASVMDMMAVKASNCV